MARTEMVRWTCNRCLNNVDVPAAAAVGPQGWRSFIVTVDRGLDTSRDRQIDLCGRHSDDLMDYVDGTEGPHRIKAEEAQSA